MVLQCQEEKCPASPGPESGSSGLFSEPANLKANQECGEEREGVSGGSHPGRPLCLHLGTLGRLPRAVVCPTGVLAATPRSAWACLENSVSLLLVFCEDIFSDFVFDFSVLNSAISL